MEPDYELEWTDRAILDYESLTEYLFLEWGERIALKSMSRIDAHIQRIKRKPAHFPIFIQKNKIRRCVASRQTSIFFIAKEKSILLLSIFDNRLDPGKYP